MPAGVAKGCAPGTDCSLRHKAFVCSGPDAGAAMRTSGQRTIRLGPDCTPTTTSLLYICWQGLVAAAPLGTGISPVRGVIQRQTPCSLRAPNRFFPHPVPLPLPSGGGDHHKLPRQLLPSALLVALGPETDRLVWRRRVATVARGSGGGEVQKAWNVDCLYCRLAYVQRMTGMDNVANGQQVVRCKIAMTAHNGRERNWRLTVKDMVIGSLQKGLGNERINGGGDGNGGCKGEGVGVGIMGRRPTNLGFAILA